MQGQYITAHHDHQSAIHLFVQTLCNALIRFYNAFSLSDWRDKQDISTAVRDKSHQCLAAWVGSNKTPLLLCLSLPMPAHQTCWVVKVSFETAPCFWFGSEILRSQGQIITRECFVIVPNASCGVGLAASANDCVHRKPNLLSQSMSSFGAISEGSVWKDFTLVHYLMFTLALIRACIVST